MFPKVLYELERNSLSRTRKGTQTSVEFWHYYNNFRDEKKKGNLNEVP